MAVLLSVMANEINAMVARFTEPPLHTSSDMIAESESDFNNSRANEALSRGKLLGM